MDISKDTALNLQRTAAEFQQADERLRTTHEPSEQMEFVREAASDYLDKRKAHQEAIAAAEQEIGRFIRLYGLRSFRMTFEQLAAKAAAWWTTEREKDGSAMVEVLRKLGIENPEVLEEQEDRIGLGSGIIIGMYLAEQKDD